jgi:formate C-acetyltransferase
MADVKESMEIRYARAVQQFLSNKLPLFFDENLLAGTTTSKPFGAPVYPELTGMTIWPELDTMNNREKNPQRISRSDADELNFDIFPYWMNRNIIEATRAREGNPACMKLFERIIFFIAGKAGTISHTVPCYKIALENGLEWLIEEAAKKEKDLRSDDNLFHETLQQLDFIVPYRLRLKE